MLWRPWDLKHTFRRVRRQCGVRRHSVRHMGVDVYIEWCVVGGSVSFHVLLTRNEVCDVTIETSFSTHERASKCFGTIVCDVIDLNPLSFPPCVFVRAVTGVMTRRAMEKHARGEGGNFPKSFGRFVFEKSEICKVGK